MPKMTPMRTLRLTFSYYAIRHGSWWIHGTLLKAQVFFSNFPNAKPCYCNQPLDVEMPESAGVIVSKDDLELLGVSPTKRNLNGKVCFTYL